MLGGLSVAGWEFRVGALSGGQPVGVFLNVAGVGASGVGWIFSVWLRNCVLA